MGKAFPGVGMAEPACKGWSSSSMALAEGDSTGLQPQEAGQEDPLDALAQGRRGELEQSRALVPHLSRSLKAHS